MFIIGIDPGLKGAVAFLKKGKIINLFEMPIMSEGKKNKNQLNNAQLVKIMRENEIDCFDLDSNGGKLIYTKQKIKKSLSKKHLMTCLM